MNPEFYDPIFLKGKSSVGVLLIHGFTGTPESLAPWAHGLNQSGMTVYVPRLAGHGSDWRELRKSDWGDWLDSAEQALADLEVQVDEVFVAGFSMGGAIALRLAELFPKRFAGLMLLNPTIMDNHIRMIAAKFLAPIIPSIKSEGTDVAKPNAKITSQSRLSTHAANSLHKFRHIVRRDLPLVHMPTAIYLSRQDHVVPPSNGLLIANSIRSRRVETHFFENSYHVVPQDFEVDELIQKSSAFINSLVSVEN